MKVRNRGFEAELEFKFSRSSGKGGQHINKTESRVSLFFKPQDSSLLSKNEKDTLLSKWKDKLSNEGFLQLDAEETRSQYKNKQIVLERFFELLEKALLKKKIRKATKPSKKSVQNRLKEKKKLAEKKQTRRKDNLH